MLDNARSVKGDIFFSLKASRGLIKAKNVIFLMLKMKSENDRSLFALINHCYSASD